MGEPTCTFTGHRAEKLPWGYNENDPRCRRLKRTLYDTLEAVYESGFHRFICGMAEGCDLYFCEAVLALREDHPDITLEAAVPFAGQAEHWGAAQRQRYEALLARCDIRIAGALLPRLHDEAQPVHGRPRRSHHRLLRR